MPVLGGDKEFSSSSLFATDCAVARFTGQFTEGNSLQNLEFGNLNCSSGMNGRGVVCKRWWIKLISCPLVLCLAKRANKVKVISNDMFSHFINVFVQSVHMYLIMINKMVSYKYHVSLFIDKLNNYNKRGRIWTVNVSVKNATKF